MSFLTVIRCHCWLCLWQHMLLEYICPINWKTYPTSYHFVEYQTDGALYSQGQNNKVKYKKDEKIPNISLASSPSLFVLFFRSCPTLGYSEQVIINPMRTDMSINFYILKYYDLYYFQQIHSILKYIYAKSESSVHLFKFLDCKNILKLLHLQAMWVFSRVTSAEQCTICYFKFLLIIPPSCIGTNYSGTSALLFIAHSLFSLSFPSITYP